MTNAVQSVRTLSPIGSAVLVVGVEITKKVASTALFVINHPEWYIGGMAGAWTFHVVVFNTYLRNHQDATQTKEKSLTLQRWVSVVCLVTSFATAFFVFVWGIAGSITAGFVTNEFKV